MVAYHLMPIPEVERVVGFGKSKIYAMQDAKSDQFDPDWPAPVVLSRRCVRWRSDEIQAWLDKKSSDRTVGHAERHEQARNAGKARAAKHKANAIELTGQA